MSTPVSRRTRSRLAAALVIASALLAPAFEGATLAQSKDALAKMRERFREGMALEAGGQYAQALAAFKDVAEVKSTPQVRIHIAKCEEKTGDYVRAIGSYRLALAEAQDKKLKDVEQAANESIASLEPKIPALIIKRGQGANVAAITLDQRELGATEIGSDMPLNPGPHVIEASAQGRQPFKAEITLGEGEKKTVTVKLLEQETPDVAPTVTTEPTATAPPPPTSSPVKTAGFIVGGLGIVGLGVAGAFIGLRQSTLDELEKKCGKDHKGCPQDAQGLIDQGSLNSTVATGALIGGGVALAAGIILLIAAPSAAKTAPKEEARFRLRPVVSVSPRGASFAFEF